MQLTELQQRVRDLVVRGDPLPAALANGLCGGATPAKRVLLHRRNYVTSLVGAARGRFPATAWVLGDERIIAAAVAFVQDCPPSRPCIAEYGDRFADHVGGEHARHWPWLGDLARLEWQVGRAAVAADPPALPLVALRHVAAEHALPPEELRVTLTPSLVVLPVAWPVEDVLGAFLRGDAAPADAVPHAPGQLLIAGGRGKFTIERLTGPLAALIVSLLHSDDLRAALSAATANAGPDAAADALVHTFQRGWVGAVRPPHVAQRSRIT